MDQNAKKLQELEVFFKKNWDNRMLKPVALPIEKNYAVICCQTLEQVTSWPLRLEIIKK